MLKDSYALNHQVVPIQMVEANIQKQSSRGVLKKRCSENIQQIYRRTPMSKCDFNKVALHGCSQGNLLHIFRTSLLKGNAKFIFLCNPQK